VVGISGKVGSNGIGVDAKGMVVCLHSVKEIVYSDTGSRGCTALLSIFGA